MASPRKRPASLPKFRPLELSFSADLAAAHVPYLRSHLKKAHRILSPALAEMSVALVNDRTMSDLHLRFMDIAGPTDVMTFPMETDAGGRVVGGEVVVCVPEARRRCKSDGGTLPEELLLYCLHGMLHLCGFDDRTDPDFKRMHETEDEILDRIGVGRVFDRREKPAPKPSRRDGVARAAGED